MRIGFVIFDGMTALDLVGVYDPLTRLSTMGFMPGLSWDLCSFTETANDNTGLRFYPTVPAKTPLRGYDLIVVPGGFGTRELCVDAAFLEWFGTCADTPLKASVCTGSLLLGAVGLLRGRKATTHRSAQADLVMYAGQVTDDRVVDEGDIITARGVTSALHLGLHLCRRLAGPEVAATISQQMDFLEHQ